MATEVIFCPACNHKLRVPDDLMGTEVQCPRCGKTFVAPPPPDAVLPAESPEATPRPATRDDWDDDRQPRSGSAGTRRKAAGLALAGVGLLHVLANGVAIATALANPDQVRQQFQQVAAMFPAARPFPFDVVKMQLLVSGAFLVLSLVQAVGGVCVLQGRFYMMALVGAVLAIVNCNDLCCLLSVPVGIWALVVLFDADVKADFV